MVLRNSFRPDRALSLGFFGPIAKWLGRISTNWHGNERLPILMYHSISAGSDVKRHPFFQYHTTPETFKMHMATLYEEGYRVISLEAGCRILKNKEKSNKTVVITFDDGYQNFLESAWPIMKRYQFPATVFIATSLVGQKNALFKNRRCLSWEEIFQIASEGVEIGSHSMTHPRLNELSPSELESEIVNSKKILEDKLGQPINSFSCPYAFPEKKLFKNFYLNVLEKAGYKYGVTTRIGRASCKNGLFLLNRLPVNDFDDNSFFQAKLAGEYDWMYWVQTGRKIFKN